MFEKTISPGMKATGLRIARGKEINSNIEELKLRYNYDTSLQEDYDKELTLC